MKLLQINLWLLLCASLLSGCIGEDMDSCPSGGDESLILEFRYRDETGKDIFADKIGRVDVFAYDSNNILVLRQTADRASISAFAGMGLNLQPGTYRIVCWGNALDKTMFGGSDTGSLFGDAFTGNSTIDANEVATNGDPLYYAPAAISPSHTFTVTIPGKGQTTATIDFCTAHIKIEVYVKGFEDRTAAGESLPPGICLTDIPAYYNFGMQTSGSSVWYRDNSSFRTVADEQLAAIDFYTPLFREGTPTQVLIQKQSDGSSVTTFSLKDFIEENNIIIDSTRQTVIPILVEYKQTSVEITLPGWGHKPIKPETR